MFVRGGWGEVRVGNEDSVVEILKIGGFFNNAGTGGLDGDQRTAREVFAADSGEATKILYFTPKIAGFQGGISYAFNGEDSGSFAGSKDATQDHVEAGVNWLGEFGSFELGAFAGLSSFTPEAGVVDRDRALGWTVGGLVGFGGVSLAAGYFDNDDDALGDADANPIDWSANIGIGGELDGFGLSFAFQHDELRDGNEQYYVLSADRALLPGLALRGELAYLDGDDDSGVNGLLQLHTAW